MTIKQNFSNSKPSLNLNFALSKKLDPTVTFTRPGTENGVNGATQVNKRGSIEIVPADTARFDHDPVTLEPKGLLVEKGSTNLIRNNTLQGAGVGVPGSVPTNWSIGSTSGGVARTIVDVGEEDGIRYMDIRWSGTATSSPTTYWSFRPETLTNNIPGNTTTRYTFSSYVKLVGGSVPNNSTFILVFRNDTGTTNLGEYRTFTVPLTNTVGKRLSESRYYLTNTTFSNASTAYIVPYYQWNFSGTTEVDVTLRIGMPQCELGTLMSSIISTSGQDGTRATETVSIEGDNFTKWFNQREGTIIADMGPYFSEDTGNFGISIGSASNNYLAFPYITAGGTYSRDLYWRDPSVSEVINFPDGSSGGKYAISYKNGERLTGYFNGALGEDTVGPWPNPTGYNSLYIGRSHFSPGERQYFYLKQLIYYPTSFSNSTLQTFTLTK
jgi:hypothetical protein